MRDGADSVSRVRHQVSGRNSIGVSSVAREHGIGCIATVKILLSLTFTLLSFTESFTLLSLTESYRVFTY